MNSSLSEHQISMLRAKLEQELRELEQRLQRNDHYGLAESLRDSTNELSPIDNHPGDLGTEMFERGKDLALMEHSEEQEERIRQALDRMNEGTYGICAECGEPIPFERLEAVPGASYCVKHVPNVEEAFGRPIEEQFLEQGFGRTSEDGNGDPAFDGEDAWQIVSEWGNSNSPALMEERHIDHYNDVETDENEGFVEPIESFLATDIYGNRVTIVRNGEYRKYMENREGIPLLEPEWDSEDLRGDRDEDG